MNYPTTSNPLVLSYRGRVPALKNDKNKITDRYTGKDKLIPNESVLTFIKTVKSALPKQVQAQNFSRLVFPMPVACYVELYFSLQELHGIPNADGDNAYTTVQETWQMQEIVGTMGAVLGIIDDDRQILNCSWDTYVVSHKQLEGANAYIWTFNPKRDRWDERAEFAAWLRNHKAKRGYNEDVTIDFSEIDSLF